MNDAAEPAFPLESQLCFSLYGASLAITRLYKPLLDRMGITYPQYLVLHALLEEDGRTVGAIADRLSLDSSTITPLVKRLALAGLVVRERDARDERQVRVRLTERGRGVGPESACLGEAVLARTGYTPAALAALTEQIQSLRRALAQEAPTP